MSKIFVVAAFLFNIAPLTHLCAQRVDFINYTPLESTGALPVDLTTKAYEKYNQERKKISNNDRRKIKKAKKEFYLKSTFGLDDLLKSGKVLFNDPVGDYVNRVFAKVLEADGDVKKEEVSLYVIKTNYSNAFATDQGVIFVTTGLLARLENEAQLAFILCHELIHYKKKHSIDIFINAKQGESSSGSSSVSLFSQAAYSKEKESEADRDGVRIFLKTGYSSEASISVFNVLIRSHLPFSSAEFDRGFVEQGPFKWPNNIFIANPSAVYVDEKEDDSLSTHPNAFKRKEQIATFINNEKGQAYLVSEEEFLTIKKICRFEYCREALLSRNYVDAFYAAYSLLKEDSNSVYLKKIIAKSLYSMSMYYNQDKKDRLGLYFQDLQGGLQKTTYFFRRLTAYELNTFAAYYIYSLNKEYPNDNELKLFLDETLYWLAYLHYPTIENTNPADQIINDKTPLALIGGKTDLKREPTTLDSIRLSQNNYCFNTMLNLDGFGIMYKTALEKVELDKANVKAVSEKTGIRPTAIFLHTERNKDCANEYKRYMAVKAYDAQQKEKLVRKKYTGIFNNKLNKQKGEKIIFLNPEHYSADFRKKTPLLYVASEKSRDVFVKRLSESAEGAKIPFEMLSDNLLDTTGVGALNTIISLREWYDEVRLHEGIQITPSDQYKINQLSERLQSRYLCFAGNVYATLKKDNTMAIVYSIIVPFYSWPFTIPYLLSKEVETAYYMFAIDLKTGKKMASSYSSVKMKNRQDISLSIFYDFLQEVKIEQQINK